MWLESVLEPTKWRDIFDGNVPLDDPCWRAHELAALNDATALCWGAGPLRFEVEAVTDRPVGDSIVPGTEAMTSTASASAVIEPRCVFEVPGEDADQDTLPGLTCEDQSWPLDPDDLDDLPKPEDLFDVHLAD
ncbi:hypothetical protein SUDANB96_04360 [Streptomyces sp. enrichment culture]